MVKVHSINVQRLSTEDIYDILGIINSEMCFIFDVFITDPMHFKSFFWDGFIYGFELSVVDSVYLSFGKFEDADLYWLYLITITFLEDIWLYIDYEYIKAGAFHLIICRTLTFTLDISQCSTRQYVIGRWEDIY